MDAPLPWCCENEPETRGEDMEARLGVVDKDEDGFEATFGVVGTVGTVGTVGIWALEVEE